MPYTNKWGFEVYDQGGGHAWANDSLLVSGNSPGYVSNYVPIQLSLMPPQARPLPAQSECELPQGSSVGGICVGMGDGSARTVSYGVDPLSWALLLLPNDGSPLPADVQ